MNNILKNVMGQGHGQGEVSDQSGVASKSWYPVITASSYKVTVLVMSVINYVTLWYINATQNTPHKICPGDGLKSLIALFLVRYPFGLKNKNVVAFVELFCLVFVNYSILFYHFMYLLACLHRFLIYMDFLSI